MKKKVNMQELDFEVYLSNALKSHGYLFPETDEQMSIFEETMSNVNVPQDLNSPDFIFEFKRRTITKVPSILHNSEVDNKWAIAAREGKDIPTDILQKMKRDKAEAKKNKTGDRKSDV